MPVIKQTRRSSYPKLKGQECQVAAARGQRRTGSRRDMTNTRRMIEVPLEIDRLEETW